MGRGADHSQAPSSKYAPLYGSHPRRKPAESPAPTSRRVVLAAVDRSMGLGVTVEGPIAAHHRFVGVAQMADDTDPERFVRGFTSEDECLGWFSEIKGENEGPLWPEDGLLWPDVIVDLQAPAETAVRDASDAMLGDPYPFDEDHVIFA